MRRSLCLELRDLRLILVYEAVMEGGLSGADARLEEKDESENEDHLKTVLERTVTLTSKQTHGNALETDWWAAT